MDRGQWFGFVSPDVHGQLQKWTVAILTLTRNQSPPTTRHGISKRSMCRPTRPPNRGRLLRPGEMSEDYVQPLHRGAVQETDRDGWTHGSGSPTRLIIFAERFAVERRGPRQIEN